jgi:hypothetical protein
MKNLDTFSICLFKFVKFVGFVGVLGLSACSPKIYLIDRQTVLEDEAASEWPEFEKDLLEKSKAIGPTPFAKTNNTARKERLYNVLNGELTTQSPQSKKD